MLRVLFLSCMLKIRAQTGLYQAILSSQLWWKSRWKDGIAGRGSTATRVWGESHFVQTVFLLSAAAHNLQECTTVCIRLSNQYLIPPLQHSKGTDLSDEQSSWAPWDHKHCGFECLIPVQLSNGYVYDAGTDGGAKSSFHPVHPVSEINCILPWAGNLSCLQWFIAQVSHFLIKSEIMKQHFSRQFLVVCSVLQQFAYFHNPKGSECLWYSPNGMVVCL